ncbi:hypothetical protein [Nocardioides humi]|uniref:hypothetical protein n=1 Tax=Nocardioides humi TaxID=449461 RepID=UPI0031D47CCE
MVTAARFLDASEFGVFAVVSLAISLLIGGAQALLGQELVLVRGDSDVLARRGREALSVALSFGALAAVVVLAASPWVGRVALPLALASASVPLLFVQETARSVAAVRGQAGAALALDLTWMLAMVGLLAVVLGPLDWRSAEALIVGWCGAGALAGLVAWLALGGGLPRPTLPQRYRARNYLGFRFLLEFAALRASSQLLVILLGAMASVDQTGAYRLAITVFGPLTVVILASFTFGAPILRGASSRQRSGVLCLGAFGMSAVTAMLLALLLTVPTSFAVSLLGASWSGGREFLPPVAAQTAATAVSTMAFLGLRMTRPRSTLRLRVVPAALMPVAFFVGFWLGGAVGAAWGIAATAVVQATTASLVLALHEYKAQTADLLPSDVQ